MTAEPDVAIQAEGLTKRYRLGPRQRYHALRDRLAEAATAPVRRLRQRASSEPSVDRTGAEVVTALDGVSFRITRGEVVGIIGPNGAGKTTLLKLLARITEPTDGCAYIRGRVGSLLEVGTGFHPELTGRENIYLNGAILGMSRAEIARKFDAIAEFSGVERFLEAPVKRYSSGMSVRLAFAVAAHLDPEVLVVDEVLAVGDLEFQRKCLGKMQEVARGGRTILFVSHNMSAITSLCHRVLLLERGRVTFDGHVAAGVSRYVSRVTQAPTRELETVATRRGTGQHARIVRLSLFDEAGRPQDTFVMGQGMTMRLELACRDPIARPEIGIAVSNQMGITLHLLVSSWEGLEGGLAEGAHAVEITVPALTLYPGRYVLTPWVKHQGTGVDDQVDQALTFEVIGADVTGHHPYFEQYTSSGCETYVPSQWKWL